MANEPTPNPNVMPEPEECFANSARMLRGVEFLDDPNKMAVYLEAGNRWMELGAVIHSVMHGDRE